MVVKNVWMVVKNVLSRVLNSLVLNLKQRHTVTERSGRMAKGLLEQRDIKNNCA